MQVEGGEIDAMDGFGMDAREGRKDETFAHSRRGKKERMGTNALLQKERGKGA